MLGEALRDGLRQESYVVDWVRDGGAALAALSTATFSALVLDLGLPTCDGITVLRWLRQNGRTIPVVIVTARDRLTDRIADLDAGADDYLIKPFDIDELGARLRAITRRALGCAESMLIVGEEVLDLRQRVVTCQSEPAGLTAREYAVVELLMRKAGCLVTRAEIEEELYGFEDDIASNAIEVHIHNLRRKLGPRFITNLNGRGYRVAIARERRGALVSAPARGDRRGGRGLPGLHDSWAARLSRGRDEHGQAIRRVAAAAGGARPALCRSRIPRGRDRGTRIAHRQRPASAVRRRLSDRHALESAAVPLPGGGARARRCPAAAVCACAPDRAHRCGDGARFPPGATHRGGSCRPRGRRS